MAQLHWAESQAIHVWRAAGYTPTQICAGMHLGRAVVDQEGAEMTQSIRDAAQALLDALDNYHLHRSQVGGNRRKDSLRSAANSMRAALSAPQPTADERVAKLVKLVEDAVSQAAWPLLLPSQEMMAPYIAAVEQSARALLSASQEDAEQAAMYRWLRDRPYLVMDDSDDGGSFRSKEKLDAAIRAAMSAKETK